MEECAAAGHFTVSKLKTLYLLNSVEKMLEVPDRLRLRLSLMQAFSLVG